MPGDARNNGAESPSSSGTADPNKLSPNMIGLALMVIPNGIGIWQGAKPKGAERFINSIIRTAGIPGLFMLPFVTLTLEKSYYDSVLSLQGVSPNVIAEDRKHEGFPSGGHLLPSFSLFPVKHIREYF